MRLKRLKTTLKRKSIIQLNNDVLHEKTKFYLVGLVSMGSNTMSFFWSGNGFEWSFSPNKISFGMRSENAWHFKSPK